MSRLDRAPRFGGRARYAVLADALLEDIEAGVYPVGSLLPTEIDLCREFNVSRHTMREALRRLVDLGLLSRQAGVGTTVVASRVASRYVQTGEDANALMRYAQDVRLQIISDCDQVVSGELADLIGATEGTSWLHLSGERFTGDDPVPIALSEIWIARPYRSIRSALSDAKQPIYALLERRFGIVTGEIRQRIEAVILTDEAAARLGVAKGAPGLRITRSYVSASGEVFETAISLHPAERFSYSNTFSVEADAS